MIESEKLYTIRDLTPSDKSFILSTFLKGLKFGSDFFKEIDNDAYFKNYQKIIESLISQPKTEVKVACLTEDPDVILGYSIHDKDGSTVHFVFVKSAWRGVKIAKALVPKTATTATHITKIGLSLVRKRGIKFNPFAI